MKLYELNATYNQLLEMADDLDPQVLKDTLESIKESIEDKAENTAKLIRSWEAEAKAIKEEEKRLAERRKALESNAKRTKEYLFEQLEIAGIQKVKRPLITVYTANNPHSVEILDSTLIPSSFIIQKDPEIDKKGLIEAIKRGEEIPGAKLYQGRGLRIK